MFTLAAFLFFACVVMPIVTWALRLTVRILGWTLRMALGIFLLPVWIVVAVCCGLAFALHWLVPVMLVAFVLSLVVPES